MADYIEKNNDENLLFFVRFLLTLGISYTNKPDFLNSPSI